jgi:hypothetical protein
VASILCFASSLGSLRAAAAATMAVVEGEQACGRVLEAGIVNRAKAAALIPDLPPRPETDTSPVGHIAFRRHFFTDESLGHSTRQSLYCAAFAGTAGALSLVGLILYVLHGRERGPSGMSAR